MSSIIQSVVVSCNQNVAGLMLRRARNVDILFLRKGSAVGPSSLLGPRRAWAPYGQVLCITCPAGDSDFRTLGTGHRHCSRLQRDRQLTVEDK